MVAITGSLPFPDTAGDDDKETVLPLPLLREDLGLFPGSRNARGEKGWMLHDPLRNRYFQVGEREFALLSWWEEAGTVQALCARAEALGLPVDESDIMVLADFLVQAELVRVDQGAVARLGAAWRRRQQSWWQKLLHNYLFFKVPLLRPDALLDRFYPRLRILLSRRFAQVTALAGLLGVFLVLRQWELFLATFMGFLNWEGALAFGAALTFVKVFHEAGHALACRHFGLRVPSIGVAFIVMWPVMYTDATEAWRLTSRRARLAIAAAGMLTELSIACYATLLWVLLPDGVLRSAVFTLATTTWVMSLAVNLNPLMRFDGYYLFSDAVNIPNLQERGFELARNRLRHVLFGIPLRHDPGLDAAGQRMAIGWAYATWVYRFFLFLGIAFLVYAFFFKALGIFLFIVEIWWFLAAPIWREIRNWKTLAVSMGRTRQRWLAGGALLFLLVLCLPWESSFRLPAVMRAGELQRLYPVEAARVERMNVANGSRVQPGDILFELASPDLEAELARGRAEVASAAHERVRVLASRETSGDRQVAEESLARAEAVLQGLESRRERLRVLAPFEGIVSDVPPLVRPGLWLGERQPLGLLVGTRGGVVVDAWVAEEYLRFVRPGARARFYPDDPTVPPQEGVVAEVDAVDSRVLPEPYLVGSRGEGIPVRFDRDGQAIPEYAVYRVRITLETPFAEAPLRVMRGHVRLGGDSRSLLGRAGRFVAGVFRRESGF